MEKTADQPIDLERVAKTVGLPTGKVRATVDLLDAGNTVPFITRYRKDQTGGLDEEQIRQIEAEVGKQRALADRKQTILRSIESQGKLTEELAAKIKAADNVRWLEDLYLPFKPKKQTRATAARDRGLGPLAEEILAGDKACADLDARAADFINTDRQIATAAEALLGAGHILAEKFSERANLRHRVRRIFHRTGQLVSTKAEVDEKKSKAFRDYFDFRQPIDKLPPHRVLAINRGEKAKALRVRIESDEAAIQQEADGLIVPEDHAHADFLRGCLRDALARLVQPSLEREVRRELTEKAETHAVEVFARNLRNLLLQAPVRQRRVLAIDPGFKSGCKLCALDEFGELLANDVIHLVGSDEKKQQGRARLVELIRQHQLKLVAIGNGAACRETEELLAELIAEELAEDGVSYVVVNEAGASVYSASPLAREEMPDYDATVRGAVSIGRRLQDPLSELVKIDPASIGVGMYQHDVRASHLRSSLDAVVQSCVNYVGVDLNSASPALLRYVSGLNALTARRLYDHRQSQGPFRSRQQLLEVQGFGESAFVQAAGFLKIRDAENPLDATWIHPESYPTAEKLLARFDCQVSDLSTGDRQKLTAAAAAADKPAISAELGVGELLLDDLLANLDRPGRDPREDLPPPIFRKGVVKLEDLAEGMELTGTVLNVVDFGAFVDIGLSDSGLVHISQVANRYVRDPHEVVAVGDIVKVWVQSIDKDRRRVALTMIEPGTEKPVAPREKRERPPKREGAPRGKKRRDGKRPDAAKPRPHKPKPKPKPIVPITKKMAEGREPMRTFGDLIQFYEKKPKDGDPNES
jgi:uncharacterized protein